MRFAHGETVTRLRATPKLDPYSGEASGKDWSDPDQLLIPGVALGPGTTAEAVVDARNEVVTTATLYGEVGMDIVAGDRIRARGVLWEVDGDLEEYRHPMTGWQAGATANLKKVEG